MSKKYFSLSETARELECSESSVFKLIKQGKLSPSYVVNHVLRGRNKISGGQFRFFLASIRLVYFRLRMRTETITGSLNGIVVMLHMLMNYWQSGAMAFLRWSLLLGLLRLRKTEKRKKRFWRTSLFPASMQGDVSECVLDMPIRVEMKEIVILGRDLQGYLESKGKTLSDGSSSVDKLLVVTDEPQKQSKQEEIDALMKEIRCNALADIAEERKKGTLRPSSLRKWKKTMG